MYVNKQIFIALGPFTIPPHTTTTTKCKSTSCNEFRDTCLERYYLQRDINCQPKMQMLRKDETAYNYSSSGYSICF